MRHDAGSYSRTKGAYAGHRFADTPEAELRWLWGEISAHVLAPYPFVREVAFSFALAYNDSWYAPHSSLDTDGAYLEYGTSPWGAPVDYLEVTPEYAADPRHTTTPLAGSLAHDAAYDLERAAGLQTPTDLGDRVAWRSYRQASAELLDEHYGHYREPLLRAHSLLGAVMHDFEEGYFVWLFGYEARVAFTREGVTVGPSEEFGSVYPGLDSDEPYVGIAEMRARRGAE